MISPLSASHSLLALSAGAACLHYQNRPFGGFLSRWKEFRGIKTLCFLCAFRSLQHLNIGCPDFAAVLWILFNVIRYLLTFRQRLVSVCSDGGEMNKDIVAAILVGYKSEAFFGVKPFTVPLFIRYSLIIASI
jgi:hypothetical protein